MLNRPTLARRLLAAVLFATITCAAVLGTMRSSTIAAEKANADTRFFELRTYTTNEGKLDALLSRFRDHTTKLFEKHGMTNVAYWVPETKAGEPEQLIYVMAYPSREARDASWKAFLGDPDWQKVYAESTADGKLVSKVDSVFMNPTDFSPMQ